MSKIAYVYAVLDESYKEKYPGINNKIEAQVKELNRSGVKTDLIVSYFAEKMKRMLPFQTSSVDWMSLPLWEKYDGLYLRYPMADYQMNRWFRTIKAHNPDFKIVIEIPTYPYENELKHRNKLIILRDHHYRKQLHRTVDRLVVNSQDNQVFGIQTIQNVNGVDLDTVRKRKPKISSDGVTHICMVAAFSMWHGVDRLLKGLQNYYQSHGTRKILLHLVGSGEDNIMLPLKKLAAQSIIKDHVIFHGFLSGEELSDIYDNCQLAVASLGLHRLDIDAPSTLKSREYLARGIPFVYSNTISDFAEHPVDFVKQISNDDKPVDFMDILDFYDELVKRNDIYQLTDRIRKYASNYVSIEKIMKPVEDFFKGN